MPSPFPGMDPYLEDPAYWSDFHASFLLYLRDAVNDCLPDYYEARIDEKISLAETNPDRIKLIEPDLALTREGPSGGGSFGASAVAMMEPVTIPHLAVDEEQKERWIEILHRPERSLVTVVELLSPANKEEPGLHRYRDKRNSLLAGPTHLVEIDLLLKGRRLPLCYPLPAGDYYARISRGDHRPDCQVYAWTLAQALPPIPIPLKAPDADLTIHLAEVFDIAYDKGRYARSLPYAAPPTVRLTPEQREWATQKTRR